MRFTKKPLIEILSYSLIFLVICTNYAFNDQKIVLYSVKIIFIIFMSIRFIIKNTKITLYFLWVILFLLLSLVSVLWATDQGVALYHFTWALQILLISLFIGTFIEDTQKLRFTLKSITIGALILIVRLFIQTPMDEWGLVRLGGAINYNANSIGISLAFAALCSAYLITADNKKLRYTLLLILFVFVSLLTGSRKAFLLIGLGLLSYYVLMHSKNIVKFSIFVPLIVIGLFGFYNIIMEVDIFYDVLGQRVEDLLMLFEEGTTDGGSINTRVGMIQAAIKYFMEQPVLGLGLGNFSEVSNYGVYAHNNYVEILSNLGIAGFTIYYSLIIYILIKLIKKFRINNTFFALPLTIMMLIIINDFGMVSYHSMHIQILISIAFSWLSINGQKNDYNSRLVQKEIIT